MEYLQQLVVRQDRAALAGLRRVLGRKVGDVPEADRLLLPWLPATMAEHRTAMWYLVAGLFAFHPSGGGDMSSLGESIRRLQPEREGAGVERRFLALLQAHPDELANHLRRFVHLLKAAGVRVDWAQTLRDVQRWGDDDRRVQRRWARDFWGARETDARPSPHQEMPEATSAEEAHHDR